ncbi:MAG: Panacea domain-containing protein [Candidatus Shapirobacteria bacterium]|nr:Panacea domain-containing protein [Candidatus Shapirobacteria bacterium]
MLKYTLDKEKYKAAFLYIINSLGKIEGMKKAYKLFYFLDFDFYEAYEKPFTGDIYKSLKMGPVPVYFNGIVDELIIEKKIKVEKTRMSLFHDNDTVIYKPLAKTNYKFSNNEKKMLDRIINLYGNQSGKSLELLSHSEAPYNAVDLYQIIPYEYSFYRDTPNLTV